MRGGGGGAKGCEEVSRARTRVSSDTRRGGPNRTSIRLQSVGSPAVKIANVLRARDNARILGMLVRAALLFSGRGLIEGYQQVK